MVAHYIWSVQDCQPSNASTCPPMPWAWCPSRPIETWVWLRIVHAGWDHLMRRLAGLTYTVYIIHLVRIWLLGIWDQVNWVPWPFSSFCLNHLISRKSLILSFHGYFFHVILVCDFFHLSLCIMNTLFWNFIYNSLFLLPIMSDQDAIGTVRLRMSSPRLRKITHFWPGCHWND